MYKLRTNIHPKKLDFQVRYTRTINYSHSFERTFVYSFKQKSDPCIYFLLDVGIFNPKQSVCFRNEYLCLCY